jgi:hypothetical protein
MALASDPLDGRRMFGAEHEPAAYDGRPPRSHRVHRRAWSWPRWHAFWRRHDAGRLGPYAVAAGFTAAGAFFVLAAIAKATSAHPPSCSGVGFGCSLSGADAAGFFAALGWPFALLPVGLVGLIDLAQGSRAAQYTFAAAVPVVGTIAIGIWLSPAMG